MASSRIALCAFVSLLLACDGKGKAPHWYELHGVADPASERVTKSGKVVGALDPSGAYTWLGIPYAQPPVGPLRWKAPRPPAPWTATRSTLSYGQECPQFGGFLSRGTRKDVVGSEDCLTLNVFAPSNVKPGADHRPVMVWLHGGGNSLGTAGTYHHALNLAAKYGVVMVTLNYRLGVLGFFRHGALNPADASAEDRSGNYGLLDQIAALRWVQQNIASFGGDPNQVTLFGESAGGFDVYALLASPLARGLFVRSLIESGMPQSHTVAEAEHARDDAEPGDTKSSTELVLSLLQLHSHAKDRAAAKAQLASMSPEQVDSFLRGFTPAQLLEPYAGARSGMYLVPAMVRDGTVLPADKSLTESVAKAEAAHPIPLLVGTNRDEYKIFMAMDPCYVSLWLGKIPHIKNAAIYEAVAGEVSDAWRAVGVDGPAHALNAVGNHSVYAYRFDWDEEPSFFGIDLAHLLGAGHGMEVAFVFLGTGEFPGPFSLASKTNSAGRVALSEAMASYWVQFARTGSPGKGVEGTLPEWTPYAQQGTEGHFMVLDTPAGGGQRMAQQVHSVSDSNARIFRTLPAEAACHGVAELVQRFAVPTGYWDAGGTASFVKQCPSTDLSVPVE